MQLDGRVVLITGAARRIGRAIALRLAQDRCRLAVHYKSSAAEAARTAQECCEAGAAAAECFCADLADPAAAAGLVEDVLTRFGRLDVLINNAGVFSRMTLADFRLEEWERTLRVNLTAPLVLVHKAREALEQAGGRVINLCDAGAFRAWPGYLSYVVSKAGLEVLTRVLARALAPRVNVVGVAPGIAAWPVGLDEPTRQKLLRRVPLQRAGSPEDIAATVHFLLAEGDYITGTIIPVDGGGHLG